MQRSWSGVFTVLVLVLLTSTSCSPQTGIPGDSVKPQASSTDRAGCERTGSGFALSLAIDEGGKATPLAAAVHFGDHGGVPGYRAPANEWVSAPNPTDSEGKDVDGVTLRTDHLFLHVIQLTDATWAVDNGGHCATTS